MGFLSFRYSLVRLRGLPYASSEQASAAKNHGDLLIFLLEEVVGKPTKKHKHNNLTFSGLMMSS